MFKESVKCVSNGFQEQKEGLFNKQKLVLGLLDVKVKVKVKDKLKAKMF